VLNVTCIRNENPNFSKVGTNRNRNKSLRFHNTVTPHPPSAYPYVEFCRSPQSPPLAGRRQPIRGSPVLLDIYLSCSVRYMIGTGTLPLFGISRPQGSNLSPVAVSELVVIFIFFMFQDAFSLSMRILI
jgi:hypothetical protein